MEVGRKIGKRFLVGWASSESLHPPPKNLPNLRREASMSQVQVEQKTYQMPPQDGFTVAYFDRRRHRTIGSILRNGVRRSCSEQRRQQRRAGVHPDREHVAHRQRRGRSDTRQAIGDADSIPADPILVSSFSTNIRVADIEACYELWRSWY